MSLTSKNAMQLCFQKLCFMLFTLLFMNATSRAQSMINNVDDEIFRQPFKSYQHLLSVESEFEMMTDDEKLLWLVQKAQSEYLLEFVDDFNKTTKKANALVSTSTPAEIKARVDYFSAIVLQNASQYEEAIAVFRRSLKLATDNNLNDIYIIAKQNIAYTQSIIEEFDTSLADIKIAHDRAIELNDDFLLASVNEAYGAIYFFMQYYEKSIESYKKALKSYRMIGYPAHSAEAIYGLAKSYRYSGQFSLAIQYFRLYADSVSYTPSKSILFFANYGLSMSLAEQGNCEQALVEIEKALGLSDLQDFNAELYKQQASCLIKLNQLALADIALKKAAKIYIDLPELSGTAWQLEVIKISSDLANAYGDISQRDVLLENYYQSYANLLIDKSNSRVINVRSSMKNELQEIEHAIVFQRKNMENFENKHSTRLQIYFFCLVLSLLLIVTYIIIFQQKTYKKMKKLSSVDLLSGLSNRHHILQSLAEQINTLAVNQTNLSIMLLSVDNFRQINTHYGHAMGDKVIKMFAALGQATFSKNTDIGRINDREFLCLLPSSNSKQAEKDANNLLHNIKQQSIQSPSGQAVVVDISVGIAEYSLKSNNAETIFTQAEQALGRARRLGVNCSKIYQQADGVCL
jgi:diguanylate cyclase (GGDEF)-like protein